MAFSIRSQFKNTKLGIGILWFLYFYFFVKHKIHINVDSTEKLSTKRNKRNIQNIYEAVPIPLYVNKMIHFKSFSIEKNWKKNAKTKTKLN